MLVKRDREMERESWFRCAQESFLTCEKREKEREREERCLFIVVSCLRMKVFLQVGNTSLTEKRSRCY